jgi:acylphosphatase
VVAVGEAAALQALRQWLQQGPPAASVIEVQSVDIDVAANQHANFVTL